jgi:Zn-dependent peptidase ImmA (M78 family)
MPLQTCSRRVVVRARLHDGLMGRSISAVAEPSVMRWARQSIGLDPVGAARKIGVPAGRVEEWESGSAAPTIAQLRKAATVYNRALAVFFLPAPPEGFDTLRDFRRLVGIGAGEWSPGLHEEYRRAHLQREFWLELFDLEDRQPVDEWRLEPVPESPDGIAEAIRVLLVEHAPIGIPSAGDAHVHLNAWAAAVEAVGVLVMTTMRGKVSTKEMRAFSLYFDTAPIVMLNGADAPRGRLFSLLHEFAHLVLHTAGLCDTTTDVRAVDPDRRLEARCNAIAAAILMPSAAVRERPEVVARNHAPQSWTYEALRSAAAPFGVSAEAFLRRLVTLGLANTSFYEARRDEFLAAYEAEESRRSSGGDFYRNTARDLGKGYVRLVADAHRRRVIDSATAAGYLGVKVGQIPKLAAAAQISVAS